MLIFGFMDRKKQLYEFERLLDVFDELRVKCPWDRKQTNESLRPNTIEETYELCDALIKNDKLNICKELGDVLLHVLFYAKIGSETGDFDIGDVCQKLTDKLIFRHPHVFGEAAASNAEEVSKLWEQIKQKEGELILKSLKKDDNVILLDERGIQESSMDWASRLQGEMSKGMNIVYVVGGAYGFSKDVYDRADGKMSLSRMTFSHQMVRVIFAEQLYRAFTILGGEPYHHE